MTELAPISKAQKAITKASSPDEANEIRSRLKAIQQYLVSRRRSYETAWEAAKLQCEAAAKAGELWLEQRPGERARTDLVKSFASWHEAGFAHKMDATICVRLAELDAQDRQLYYEDMQSRRRYPSEGGLHHLWHVVHGDGVVDESEEQCPKCGAYKRHWRISP